MTNSPQFSQALAVEIPTNLALTSLVIAELSNMTRYGWIIETRYNEGTITAAFAGTKRTNRKSIGYEHSLNSSANHLKAALMFLFDQTGKRKSVRIACQSSGSKGFIFSFVD